MALFSEVPHRRSRPVSPQDEWVRGPLYKIENDGSDKLIKALVKLGPCFERSKLYFLFSLPFSNVLLLR